MAKYEKGILGMRKDPKNQMLFSFSVKHGEEWPSDSDDSDYEPPGVLSTDKPVPQTQVIDDKIEETEIPLHLEDVKPFAETKVLVFLSCLLMLFQICQGCMEKAPGYIRRMVGSYIQIQQFCRKCGFVRKWCGQPFIGKYPAGNLSISAPILFSGSSCSKALRMCDIMNLKTITTRTFHNHQWKFLQPSIHNVWQQHQTELIQKIKETDASLITGGDGRCDSPGHYIKKKLEKIAREKHGDLIKDWIQSIINHLYWSACSTDDDSVPALKLEKILVKPILLRDIKKLSHHYQTYGLEVFHSLVNQFAPKMYAYSFAGQYSRLHLAALHFNENSDRDAARTASSDIVYKLKYPKAKRGGYVVRACKEESTYDYIDKLLTEVERLSTHNIRIELSQLIYIPPPLSSTIEKPEKLEAVKQIVSRYRKQ